MPSLVEQLQADAIDPAVPVSMLLRKVKLAAVKLKLGQVEDWVGLELNGYEGDVPAYRQKIGRPKALNPYNGWIPIHAPHATMNELAKVVLRESIPSLEELLKPSDKTSFLRPLLRRADRPAE